MEPETYQDQTAAIVAIARFTNKAQALVFELAEELHEAQRRIKDLSEENGKMSLKVEALNETTERDATIDQLNAKIETLTQERQRFKLLRTLSARRTVYNLGVYL